MPSAPVILLPNPDVPGEPLLRLVAPASRAGLSSHASPSNGICTAPESTEAFLPHTHALAGRQHDALFASRGFLSVSPLSATAVVFLSPFRALSYLLRVLSVWWTPSLLRLLLSWLVSALSFRQRHAVRSGFQVEFERFRPESLLDF